MTCPTRHLAKGNTRHDVSTSAQRTLRQPPRTSWPLFGRKQLTLELGRKVRVLEVAAVDAIVKLKNLRMGSAFGIDQVTPIPLGVGTNLGERRNAVRPPMNEDAELGITAASSVYGTGSRFRSISDALLLRSFSGSVDIGPVAVR